MPIILSQTFEVVTPESAEQGEAAERGYNWQDVPHSFKEVVDLIQDGGFSNPDSSHGVPRWLSDNGEPDIESGAVETKSIHPGLDARSQRYWVKAVRAAGLLKDPIYWRGLIADAHSRGLRAEVTYKTPSGQLKGLATHNAARGVGPNGVWFVCVESFTNRVHLDNIISVKQVVR